MLEIMTLILIEAVQFYIYGLNIDFVLKFILDIAMFSSLITRKLHSTKMLLVITSNLRGVTVIMNTAFADHSGECGFFLFSRML